MKLFQHKDFEQAIIGAERHFHARKLRPAIIEKDYYVTEALRIIAAAAGHRVSSETEKRIVGIVHDGRVVNLIGKGRFRAGVNFGVRDRTVLIVVPDIWQLAAHDFRKLRRLLGIEEGRWIANSNLLPQEMRLFVEQVNVQHSFYFGELLAAHSPEAVT